MKRICPICRKPNLEGEQIICLSCKAESPYTLLEGYSSTVRISDELNKIQGYKESISNLAESLKSYKKLSIVLCALSLFFLAGFFFVYIKSSDFDNVTDNSVQNLSKLELVLDSMEKTIQNKDSKLDSLNKAIVVLKTIDKTKAQSKEIDKKPSNESFQKTIQLLNNKNEIQKAEILKLRENVNLLKEKLSKNKTTNIDSKVDSELVHIVKKGESLYTIAKRYYGNGMKYHEIINYNKIEDPKNIKEGQKLLIRK